MFGPATRIADCYRSMAEQIVDLCRSLPEDTNANHYHLWHPPQDRPHILGSGDHPWLLNPETAYHQKVSAAISQLSYSKGQNPKSTLVFPGVVICSQDTIRVIENVNQAKHDFKEAVLIAKAQNSKIQDKHITEMVESRWPGVREIFSKSGFGTICLKQAYRPIHYFSATEKASFQFYLKEKTSSLRVRAEDEIKGLDRKKLLMGDAEKAVLTKKLAAAGQILSKVGNRCTVITANVLLDDAIRSQVAGVLPIFVALPSSGVLRVDFSSLERNIEDSKRKNAPPRAINPKPFGTLTGFTLHSRLS